VIKTSAAYLNILRTIM